MRLPPFHVHLDVVFILGGVWLAYFLAVRRHARSLAPGEYPVTPTQVTLFSLGMLTLFAGANWPIHDLSERYLYSVHMVQHLLFSLVAPPMLLAGMSAWMLRALIRPGWRAKVFRFVTRPLVALIGFNAVLLLTHWPAVVDLSLRSEPAHLGLHVLLVAAALVMWWPVMSPLPEMPALPAPAQMLYLFLQSLAPTIPASFLTFGHTPLYPRYAGFPRIWGMGVMTDQLIAGLIMKIAGGLILWGFITVIFFRWFGQEQREGWDPLKWRDVDRDLRAELTRP